MTKITATKLAHMHKSYRCKDRDCPVCSRIAIDLSETEMRQWMLDVAAWMKGRGLIVITHGETSPWWHVDNASKYCYARLKN